MLFGGIEADVCGAMLPDLAIFATTLKNFRILSPVRPFYGVTIPLVGHSEFLVDGDYGVYHAAKGHLSRPDAAPPQSR
jgi:hypothetical protein